MFKPSARYCAEVKAMITVMIIPKKKPKQTSKLDVVMSLGFREASSFPCSTHTNP